MEMFKNKDFKDYVEKNNLKECLIAELIKSATHDIGHLPLSHVLEIYVIHKREFHEDMGKRILLENKELADAFNKISPTLKQNLEYVLSHDLFGFNLIDEGNYDIDRFDYMTRDLFYRGKSVSLDFEPFTIENINYKGQNKLIPVFDEKSVPKIIEFLNLRKKAYKESYFHPVTQIRDSSVAITINELIKQQSPYATNLQKFLITLRDCSSPDQINLEDYLSWDDLKFYNELLDVAEFSQNKDLSTLSTFVIPKLDAFMNMTFNILDLKNKNLDELKEEDRKLVNRIHKIIHSDKTFAKNLKNPNFFDSIVKYTSQSNKIDMLRNASLNDNIFFNTLKLSVYNPNEPIYIKTKDNKVCPLDKLSNLDMNLESENLYVAFALKPLIKNPQVLDYFNDTSSQGTTERGSSPNLNLVKAGNNISDYFDAR